MSATSVDPQRPKGQENKIQNGSLQKKDTVLDNDFEPYLSGQSNQNYQNLNKRGEGWRHQNF
uniref:YTH N6-methyladenosine RNA binding protein 1 n=1 Tax=Crocodylus porosus TaxID=8502 RepID=A0A7M4EC49_CROPO